MTEDLKPLHTIVIDGYAYNIRVDRYGRFQFYRVKGENLEQSAGRHKGYASLKECFDGLYISHLQD